MSKILFEAIDESKTASISKPFREMIKRCLRKDANLRVESADELIAIISNYSASNVLPAWHKVEQTKGTGNSVVNSLENSDALIKPKPDEDAVIRVLKDQNAQLKKSQERSIEPELVLVKVGYATWVIISDQITQNRP